MKAPSASEVIVSRGVPGQAPSASTICTPTRAGSPGSSSPSAWNVPSDNWRQPEASSAGKRSLPAARRTDRPRHVPRWSPFPESATGSTWESGAALAQGRGCIPSARACLQPARRDGRPVGFARSCACGPRACFRLRTWWILLYNELGGRGVPRPAGRGSQINPRPSFVTGRTSRVDENQATPAPLRPVARVRDDVLRIVRLLRRVIPGVAFPSAGLPRSDKGTGGPEPGPGCLADSPHTQSASPVAPPSRACTMPPPASSTDQSSPERCCWCLISRKDAGISSHLHKFPIYCILFGHPKQPPRSLPRGEVSGSSNGTRGSQALRQGRHFMHAAQANRIRGRAPGQLAL